MLDKKNIFLEPKKEEVRNVVLKLSKVKWELSLKNSNI